MKEHGFASRAFCLLLGAFAPGCGDEPNGSSQASAGSTGTAPATQGALGSSTGSSGAQVPTSSTALPGTQSSTSAPSPERLELNINFQARVGSVPFACGQNYPNVGKGGTTIRPVDFRFYVHNLRLLDLQGQEVPVTIHERELWQTKNVALLDFENSDGDCKFGGDPGLNSVVTASVPAGSYRGLRFTLGVPEALNHQDPLQLGAPFQAGGMLWSWLSGFKFLAVEFRTEQNATGLFHLGSTACSVGPGQAIACQKANRAQVDLPDYEPGTAPIVADLAALFAASDLGSEQICHSDEQACAPMFTHAGVVWEVGDPSGTQNFFSYGG